MMPRNGRLLVIFICVLKARNDMEAQFIEKYAKLSDMKPGDVAVSKDRTKFFVCGLHHDKLMKKNIPVILDVNELYNQYTDKRDMNHPVRILVKGDKFVFEK